MITMEPVAGNATPCPATEPTQIQPTRVSANDDPPINFGWSSTFLTSRASQQPARTALARWVVMGGGPCVPAEGAHPV